MRRTRLLTIFVVVGVLALAVLAVKQARHTSTSLAAGGGDARGQADVSPPADATARAKSPSVGVRFLDDPKPVAALTMQGLDGEPISSADWRGKTTIVNFWATWCAPCLQEIPDFLALQKKYMDHLQIIGLSVDEAPEEQVRQFVAEHKITYPVAIVGPDVQAKFGGVLGLPMSFVVDPQGRVVQRHIGLISPDIYEQEVRALAGLPIDETD